MASKSLQITLLAMFSVLAFVASVVAAVTMKLGSLLYALILLTGALMIPRAFSATAISVTSGILYVTLVHPLFPMLGVFLVRGLTLDLFFLKARIHEKSAKGEYDIPLIVTAMVVSGIATGLYMYFFLALFLQVIPAFTESVAAAMILSSAASNAVTGYVVPKFVMPRLMKALSAS